MTFWIYVMLVLLLSVRIFELHISKRNEQWLEERGAVQKEKWKSRWLQLLHQLFFLSIIVEYLLLIDLKTFNILFLFILIMIIAGKLWCIISLGRFWTLKKLIPPSVILFKRGPYRLVKEPYNLLTLIQLLIVPLLFGAYITAFIFPLLHLLINSVKLPERETVFTKPSI